MSGECPLKWSGHRWLFLSAHAADLGKWTEYPALAGMLRLEPGADAPSVHLAMAKPLSLWLAGVGMLGLDVRVVVAEARSLAEAHQAHDMVAELAGRLPPAFGAEDIRAPLTLALVAQAPANPAEDVQPFIVAAMSAIVALPESQGFTWNLSKRT